MLSFEIHFLEVVEVVEAEQAMTGEGLDIVWSRLVKVEKEWRVFVEWQLACTMTCCIS